MLMSTFFAELLSDRLGFGHLHLRNGQSAVTLLLHSQVDRFKLSGSVRGR